MSFDLERIWKSKGEYRRRLAVLPLAAKLQMLDELRERALTLRPRPTGIPPSPREVISEQPPDYRANQG
ncbi:MAG: hypothetical protein H0U99_01960 [Chthoniobacterales bacterium]|nr:hypothetical protein [Chthoniobacterales bacterium]